MDDNIEELTPKPKAEETLKAPNCPFCGSEAEAVTPFKPTLEEALTAKPDLKCSGLKCPLHFRPAFTWEEWCCRTPTKDEGEKEVRMNWQVKACYKCNHNYGGARVKDTELEQGRFALCPSCGSRNLVELYPDECPDCGQVWHNCLCRHEEL